MHHTHEHYMEMALAEAVKAQAIDEVPVGAVLIDGQGEVIAQGHNETIRQNDPSAHAEIITLRRAAQRVKNYRLLATALYVTVEPCVMCMGAIIHARMAQVVFGAPDPKWGAAGSLYDFAGDQRLNHRIKVIAGVCRSECQALMQNFFRSKR
jgi:tRNA(adenine34) deaminase